MVEDRGVPIDFVDTVMAGATHHPRDHAHPFSFEVEPVSDAFLLAAPGVDTEEVLGVFVKCDLVLHRESLVALGARQNIYEV